MENSAQQEQEQVSPSSRRSWRAWAGLIVALLIAWFSAESFIATSQKVSKTRFVPPLDDTYIYYQYAKQIARGQLFRYQDGEAVSTGSTTSWTGFTRIWRGGFPLPPSAAVRVPSGSHPRTMQRHVMYGRPGPTVHPN